MSHVHTAGIVECVLAASPTYIETLTLAPVQSPPGLISLTIETQLLTAKNPDERRVKARVCIERERLEALGDAIAAALNGATLPGGHPRGQVLPFATVATASGEQA